MTDMDMSQYLGAFLDETDDNLQKLDDLLLALEKNMVDMDVINEIFRAAHTLKGMAGTMGFNQMMGLTHAMEDRLDAARKGTKPLAEADINLLFSGLDTLQNMVDSIRNGGNDAHIDVSQMVAKLRGEAPMPSEEPAAPAAAAEPAAAAASELSQQEAEWVMEAKDLKMTAFSVHVTLKENCLLKAARAYMAVNRLEELGNLFKTEPSVEGLENEQFDLDFMVYLASSESAEDIKKAVEKISDIASADVKEIKAAPAPAAPTEAAAAPAPAAVAP
ncbi:Hpt domain-containing protein, partial [Fretibacterium fastidiosum]